MLVEVCVLLTTLYSDLEKTETKSSKSKRVENLLIKSIIKPIMKWFLLYLRYNRFYIDHD